MTRDRNKARQATFGRIDGAQGDVTKDDAIQAGLELLGDRVDAIGGEGQASEAYQDLCLGLDLTQVKQVNTLIGLLLAAKD